MGHATHFLERLDRIDDRQTELALALYRDDDLLKSVLASIELPPEVDRLAVSLDDATLGPFVLLTRSGRFVTCLARGMLVDGLPVVTRERFEIAAQRVQRMRDELNRLRQLRESGADSQVTKLMRSMAHAGPRLCREDAAVLARVQPLIADSLMLQVSEVIQATLQLLTSLGPLRFDKLKPLEEEGVMLAGRLAWSIAHKLPFLGLAENRTQIAKRLGDHQGFGEVMPAALAFEFGTFAHCHRALWVTARCGNRGLHFLRHLPKHEARLSRRLFREMSLGAVACASSKRRGEAKKAVYDHMPEEEEPDPEWPRDRLVDSVVGTIGTLVKHVVLAEPEAALKHQLEYGRGALRVALRTHLSEEEVALIPEDVVRAAVANLPLCWHGGENLLPLSDLTRSLPWLARAPLEELFLPRVWTHKLLPDLSIASATRWLKPFMESMGLGPKQPVVRGGEKSGRNDACACGSGKKAKRCCLDRATRS